MVSKTARKPAKAPRKKASDMKAILAHHVADAILPGEPALEGADRDEAVEFLLRAAQHRIADRSSLLLESTTAERRVLRIAVVNDDMPFLVDSIAATIAAQGLSIDRLVHPVVPVSRNGDGQLEQMGKTGDDIGTRESMIYIETPRVDARQRRELLAKLRVTLGDVRAAVSDWHKMQGAMGDEVGVLSEESPEDSALLEWLNGGMLTQLGHLKRHRDGSHRDVFGICRKSSKALLADTSYERAFDWFDRAARKGAVRNLLIIKANRISNVHRHVPLDLFIVPQWKGSGKNRKVAALSVHAGLWTSAALASPPEQVPVLRRIIAELTAELGFDPGGHTGKALAHAFTVLPHDLIVSLSLTDVGQLATTIMSLVDRPRPRLVQVRSQLDRHVFAFVWLPRDTLSTEVRLKIQDLLMRQAGTSVLDWSLEVEGGTLAMLEFMLDSRETSGNLDTAGIERELEDLLRGWGEAVEQNLVDGPEGSRATAIAARYAPAFPSSYRFRYGAEEAAIDIARLRALAARESDTGEHLRDVRLYGLAKDEPEILRLKVYHHQGILKLSDAVPALENFGFTVIKEIPTQLDPLSLGTIHEFTLSLAEGEKAALLLDRRDAIEAAIAGVLNGEAEDDPFNRLVLGTALQAREANWLRAFYRYLRQTGMGFTIYTVVDALDAAPTVTRSMIDLFVARHDPDFDGDRDKAAQEAIQGFTRGLSKVSAINDDRLLRLYRAVIDSILRTNAFAEAAQEALASAKALVLRMESITAR